MKFHFYSDIKNGRLQKNVVLKLQECFKGFENKRIEISVQKLKSTRSTQQNRYYWLLVGILSSEIGYTKEECHDLIKYKFLKQEIVIGNETEVICKSTASLSKSDFGDFISQLQIWAAELGIILPDAGTQIDMAI